MVTTITKPLYGAPCNGCGACCLAEQCPLSVMVFGPAPLCPALTRAGERWACGLIADPSRFFKPGHEAEGARISGEMLGVGTYCDAIESNADRVAAFIKGEL